MFQLFQSMLHVFYLGVAYVSYIFFMKRLTHILQVFHLSVAYVLQWLHTCFPRVLDVYVASVLTIDGAKLQVQPLPA
jgi:hypothetical protein